LFYSMGNYAEQKSLLLRVLALGRKEGNGFWVAQTLLELSEGNRMLGLNEEGIQQAKEALEIMERVGGTADQARCLNTLAYSLHDIEQFDAAQEAALRAVSLLEKGQELQICRSHRILGDIFSSKDEREKAIHHYEAALGIASSFKLHNPLFCIHHSMACLFYDEDSLDDAQVHVTQAKLHAVDDAYCLGRAIEIQARIWCRQNKFEDALSEALRANEIYGKLGAEMDLGDSRALLQDIEQAMKDWVTPGE